MSHPVPFDPVPQCSSESREKHSIVADLDGTLTRGRSSFPYFMLVALESGSYLRAVVLMLLSPLAWILYHFVSEAAGIRLLIFLSFAGLKVREIEAAARAVLPKFYANDIHPESWRVFSACGGHRCIVTANPRIMVEFFCKNHLGADKVLGTEIHVTRGGRATGLLLRPGVLVGMQKRNAVKREFGDALPDVGLGDRVTDHPFLRLCKVGNHACIVPGHDMKNHRITDLEKALISNYDTKLAIPDDYGIDNAISVLNSALLSMSSAANPP